MWLCSELDPEDGNTLFGLSDHGHGFPELGHFSLKEIAAIQVSIGLRIERDVHFEPSMRFRSTRRPHERLADSSSTAPPLSPRNPCYTARPQDASHLPAPRQLP